MKFKVQNSKFKEQSTEIPLRHACGMDEQSRDAACRV